MRSFARILIAAFSLCCLCLTPAIAANTLVVKGSTTVLPIAQAVAESYMKTHPNVIITVSGTGSADGIRELIERTTDIATSSRDLKKEEKEKAKERGVHPVPHLIAIDAIVPIVHPDNPVENLTVEQLSLIYQGKITNWKQLNGPNKSIVVVTRDEHSGTFETWKEKVLQKAKLTPRAQTQESSSAIVQAVSKDRYAVGYIGIGYLNRQVKAIKVNGVEASSHTAKSGKYPIARSLYMFTDAQPRGITADFIKFILSFEGQRIVDSLGFVSLR